MWFGSYFHVVLPTNLKKSVSVAPAGPCEKNPQTLLSKVNSLNGQKFVNNKWILWFFLCFIGSIGFMGPMSSMGFIVFYGFL